MTPLVRTILAAELGVTLASSKGIVVGKVLWYNESTFESEGVGCAAVTNDNANTIYYFDDDGLPTTGRTDTNHNNGYYLAINVPTDSDVFYADTDGSEADAEVPAIFTDSFICTDVFYMSSEFSSNPTPASCE